MCHLTMAFVLTIVTPSITRRRADVSAFLQDMTPQIALISGCSSGIGLATAVLLAKDTEKRFKVYATMRNLAKKGQLEEEGKEYLGDSLIIKQMDVCSDESVNKAVQELLQTEGKIDVLCEYRNYAK